MSRRTSIVKALANKFKEISISNGYNIDLFEQAHAKLVFWDECVNFPVIYVVAGSETREYMPSAFKWAFLNVSLKVYTKGENCQEDLELLLEDIENILDSTKGIIEYDSTNARSTIEINITSITTDEGLLAPYGVGEINLQIRYEAS